MRTLGQAANLCIRCASNKKTTCGDGIDAIRHHVNVANGDQLDHLFLYSVLVTPHFLK